MFELVNYLFVATDESLFIFLILYFMMFLMAGIFTLISWKYKHKQLKLLLISYMVLYDVNSFVIPLLFRWWFAALLCFFSILIIHKYYEKSSVDMHYKQIGEENNGSDQNELSVVFLSSFVSFMIGLVVFYKITLIG